MYIYSEKSALYIYIFVCDTYAIVFIYIRKHFNDKLPPSFTVIISNRHIVSRDPGGSCDFRINPAVILH